MFCNSKFFISPILLSPTSGNSKIMYFSYKILPKKKFHSFVQISSLASTRDRILCV